MSSRARRTLVKRDILQFPSRPSTADPPIHYATHSLEPLVSAALCAPALGHRAQAVERRSVVYWARLDEERERAEPVRKRTGREHGLDEVRVGCGLHSGGLLVTLRVFVQERLSARGEGGELGRGGGGQVRLGLEGRHRGVPCWGGRDRELGSHR